MIFLKIIIVKKERGSSLEDNKPDKTVWTVTPINTATSPARYPLWLRLRKIKDWWDELSIMAIPV